MKVVSVALRCVLEECKAWPAPRVQEAQREQNSKKGDKAKTRNW